MAKFRRKKTEKQHTEAPRKAKRSLLTHPALAGVLGLWGMALGSAAVMVMPAGVLTAAVGEGDGARLLAAGIAGLVLGAVCALAGLALVHRARAAAAEGSMAKRTVQRYQTLDPARDLGSKSLDAPLETMPFSGLGDRLAVSLNEPEPAPVPTPVPEPKSESDPEPEPGAARQPRRAEGPYGRWLRSQKPIEPAAARAPVETALKPAEPEGKELADEPLALDLAQFATLPGRNAVWVNDAPAAVQSAKPAPAPEAAPAPAPAPVTPAAPSAPQVPSAIAKLRAVPPIELSLVQMVERFAIALHERHEPGSTGARRLPAQREAALAEALRQLAHLTGEKTQEQRSDDDDLNTALRRLQQLRGAA